MSQIKRFIYLLLIVALSSVIYSCSTDAGANNGSSNEMSSTEKSTLKEKFNTSSEWNDYWYKGLAELNLYTVQQGRYRESHQGTAVNIFVTEDFSKSKQVKLDDPYNAGSDRLPVLKMNQSLKFNTGLYPYSVMLSTFLPIDRNNYPFAVKMTNSIQEWCGMAFMQGNRKDDKLTLQQFSYFETEGDGEMSFTETFTEDELWNLIRLAPEQLPQGEYAIIPSTTYLRFSHRKVQPYKASISVERGEGTSKFKLNYPALNRNMEISFTSDFPYTITGWVENYPGFSGSTLTTVAVLDTTIMLDYWNKNSNSDRALRKQLGLPEDWQ